MNNPVSDYTHWTDDALDTELLERLFKVRDIHIQDGRFGGQVGDPAMSTVANVHGVCPSQSWDAMQTVILAMHKRGWWCSLKSPFSADVMNQWSAGFTPHNTTGWNGRADHHAMAENWPRAVAIAALMAFKDGAR